MSKNYLYILPFIGLATLHGCGLPKKVADPVLPDTPVSFQAGTGIDTISVAQLSFEEYFNDEHLLGLIREVLAYNFEHKISSQQMKIAEAYLSMSRGAFLPEINAEILGSGTRYGKHTIDGVGNFDTNLSPNIEESQKINTSFSPNYWLGLTTSWEIDIWGKLRALKKSAQERFFASEDGRDLIRTALVTQTAMLYYELITLDSEKKILEENIQLQEKALEVVSLHKDVGRATELAVQQFRAQLSNSKAKKIEIEQKVVSYENQLLALTGRYEGSISRSSSLEIDAVRYLARHGHPRQMIEYRPDVQARYHELMATYADARAARAAFFPSINVSAFIGVNSFNADYLFNPTAIVYQLLGNAVAPIFKKNQLKSQFRVAEAHQEIAFLDYQNSIVQAHQEVRTLLSYIDKNQQIIVHKQDEVRALDRSVEVADNLYVTAYASYLEIISAQRSKLQADLDLIEAEKNQVHALIQLYKALGGGWKM